MKHHKQILFITLATISLLLLASDRAKTVLMFQRDGILHGELWRLLTGHFIHLNAMHWLLNATAALLALFLFYQITFRSWITLTLLSAVAISIMLLIFNPEIQWYVGFSGILHGWFVFGATDLLRFYNRIEGTLLLTAITAKLAYEQFANSISLSSQLIDADVIVDAHLYGAITGLLYAAMQIQSRTQLRKR